MDIVRAALTDAGASLFLLRGPSSSPASPLQLVVIIIYAHEYSASSGSPQAPDEEVTIVRFVGAEVTVGRTFASTAPSAFAAAVTLCTQLSAVLFNVLGSVFLPSSAPRIASGWSDAVDALGAAWLRAALLDIDPVIPGAPLLAVLHGVDNEHVTAAVLHSLRLRSSLPDMPPSSTPSTAACDVSITVYGTPTYLAMLQAGEVRAFTWHVAHTRGVVGPRAAVVRVGAPSHSISIVRARVDAAGMCSYEALCAAAARAQHAMLFHCLALMRVLDSTSPAAVACTCEDAAHVHLATTLAAGDAVPTPDAYAHVWRSLPHLLSVRHVAAHMFHGTLTHLCIAATHMLRKSGGRARGAASRSAEASENDRDVEVPKGTAREAAPATVMDAETRNALVAQVLRDNARLRGQLERAIM